MIPLTHLSIFSGIDAISYAAEKVGIVTAGQVEKDPYAFRCLAKTLAQRSKVERCL
jgi:site-specific DNA-cytosine methylase